MARNGQQIGVAGNAFWRGIPDGTVITWTGSVSGTNRIGEVFNSINKINDGDIAVSKGNRNEVVARKRTNDRVSVRISVKPKGAANTDALTIAADPPRRNDLCKLVSTGDGQIDLAGTSVTWIIDSEVDTAYTPEGEAAISMTVLLYVDDAGAAVTFEDLSDS